MKKYVLYIDDVNNGQIIFIDTSKDAIQQILDFQGQTYSVLDDCCDITAECVNRLKIIKTTCKI